MVRTKGIITLTLVISRTPEGLTVKRGAFVMFEIFKVKTKIQMHLEEYIDFKSKTSPHIAQNQKEILLKFIKRYKDISEITIEDLNKYHVEMRQKVTPFTLADIMKALRAFIRFHKHQTSINPMEITDEGVKRIDFDNVERNVIIPEMIKKIRGRPFADVALIEQIKRLRDMECLSFRKIGLAVGKDVSHVYRMYHYELTKSQ